MTNESTDPQKTETPQGPLVEIAMAADTVFQKSPQMRSVLVLADYVETGETGPQPSHVLVTRKAEGRVDTDVLFGQLAVVANTHELLLKSARACLERIREQTLVLLQDSVALAEAGAEGKEPP